MILFRDMIFYCLVACIVFISNLFIVNLLFIGFIGSSSRFVSLRILRFVIISVSTWYGVGL